MKAGNMMDIDLNSLSLDELKRLQKDVNKAVEGYEVRKRNDAFAAADAAAREMGYTLADLTGASSKKKKMASVPKYRHPENADQTWTGKGRQPDWMKEALASGQSKDDFLIKE
jgi:DNA-binding protein H-NS